MSTPDVTEPAHIRLPPILRRAAAHRPAGPARDALLCFADELEAKGDADLVSHATLRAAMDAFADDL